MNICVPLGDTRYVFRIAKFIIFTHEISCGLHSHPGLGIYKRKKKVTTLSNKKKRTRSRKNDKGQESNQETTRSVERIK